VTFGTREVTVSFGDTVALDRVTFEARPGGIVAVIGGDGAGKTTLMRTLVGLVTPDSGTVSVPPTSEVGYLPALGGSWKDLTVAENVGFVGGSHGLRGEALDERVGPMLAMANLDSAVDRLAGQLSGGMRTKLGFILAMLHQPKLVVLDEPTTGVDPVSRVELWRMISDAAAGGAAVVLSTTYTNEAERAASTVMLHEGKVVLDGDPDAVTASLNGSITTGGRPVRPEYAWRSGASYREWWPSSVQPVGSVVEPTLEDVTVVSELAPTLGLEGTERVA